MSKRRHNFGTKRFKEKSLFIFHARIALKSLILLFVRLIARGARIGKTHTHTQTDKTSTVTLAHARRGLMMHSTKCIIKIIINNNKPTRLLTSVNKLGQTKHSNILLYVFCVYTHVTQSWMHITHIPLSHGHCKVRSTRVSKPGFNSPSVHMRLITAILYFPHIVIHHVKIIIHCG